MTKEKEKIAWDPSSFKAPSPTTFLGGKTFSSSSTFALSFPPPHHSQRLTLLLVHALRVSCCYVRMNPSRRFGTPRAEKSISKGGNEKKMFGSGLTHNTRRSEKGKMRRRNELRLFILLLCGCLLLLLPVCPSFLKRIQARKMVESLIKPFASFSFGLRLLRNVSFWVGSPCDRFKLFKVFLMLMKWRLGAISYLPALIKHSGQLKAKRQSCWTNLNESFFLSLA